MKQVIATRAFSVPGASNWTGIFGLVSVRTVEQQARTLFATAGTIRDLIIRLDTAPGSGKSWTFTVYKNGVATSMVVTISDTDTLGSDLSNEVTVAAGDYFALQWTGSGTPADPVGMAATYEFEGSNANESAYPQVFGQVGDSVRYGGVFWEVFQGSSLDVWNTLSSVQYEQIVAVDGDITATYVLLDQSPGSGSGWTFTIYKNGVAQDGSGGTPDTRVTVTGPATTANATFTLPVVAGDLVYMRADPSSAPGFVLCAVSVRFEATTDGQYMIGGTTRDTHPGGDGLTRYLPPHGDTGEWKTTEAAVIAYGHTTTFAVSGLRVRVSTAPGSGNSLAFQVRSNGASPASPLEVTLTDSDVTGADTSNSLQIVDGEYFNLRTVATDFPDASYATWSMAAAIVVQIRGSFVAGENTTVEVSRAAAWGLDGATNVHDEEGVHKVFGASSVTQYLELEEMSAAPTGVANKARIWVEDNGSGKTRLMVQFGSGSAQQISIEP